MDIKLFAVTDFERDLWIEAIHINLGVPVVKGSGSQFEPIYYYVTGDNNSKMLIRCGMCNSMSRPSFENCEDCNRLIRKPKGKKENKEKFLKDAVQNKIEENKAEIEMLKASMNESKEQLEIKSELEQQIEDSKRVISVENIF